MKHVYIISGKSCKGCQATEKKAFGAVEISKNVPFKQRVSLNDITIMMPVITLICR